MLATRGDELTARKCACCAMSGLGSSHEAPPKKPFDWSKLLNTSGQLLNQYGQVDAARQATKNAEREAARREQIARTAKMAADAKAQAAAEQQGIPPPKQGMGTGTKIAIGAGVAVAAVVAVKAFS